MALQLPAGVVRSPGHRPSSAAVASVVPLLGWTEQGLPPSLKRHALWFMDKPNCDLLAPLQGNLCLAHAKDGISPPTGFQASLRLLTQNTSY